MWTVSPLVKLPRVTFKLTASLVPVFVTFPQIVATKGPAVVLFESTVALGLFKETSTEREVVAAWTGAVPSRRPRSMKLSMSIDASTKPAMRTGRKPRSFM